MNKKQLIFMWIGIAAILFLTLASIIDVYRPDYAEFAVWVLLVGLITSGLIYTFRDKKTQQSKNVGTANLRRGFQRITLVLAIVAAVFCAIIAILIVINEPDSAKGYLRWRQENYEKQYGHIEHLPNGFILELDEKKVASLKNAGFSDQEIRDYEESEFTRLKAEKTNAKEEIIELEKGFWITLSNKGLFWTLCFGGVG